MEGVCMDIYGLQKNNHRVSGDPRSLNTIDTKDTQSQYYFTFILSIVWLNVSIPMLAVSSWLSL